MYLFLLHHDVSPLLFKILQICKLHEIPCINGVNLYKVSHLSLKSKNVVKFYAHVSPIFSCRITYITVEI